MVHWLPTWICWVPIWVSLVVLLSTTVSTESKPTRASLPVPVVVLRSTVTPLRRNWKRLASITCTV